MARTNFDNLLKGKLYIFSDMVIVVDKFTDWNECTKNRKAMRSKKDKLMLL